MAVALLFLKYTEHIPAAGHLHILFLLSRMTFTPKCRTCFTLAIGLFKYHSIIEASLISLYKIWTHIHPYAYHYTFSPLSLALFLFLALNTNWHMMYLVLFLSFANRISIPWGQEYRLFGSLLYTTGACLAQSRCSINICGLVPYKVEFYRNEIHVTV